MTKKIWIVFWGIMMVAGIGSAGPLTDYSAGKVAMDLTYFPDVDFAMSVPANGTIYDAKSGSLPVEVGVTVGLGDKWAVQYRQFNLDTKEGALTHYGYLYPHTSNHREVNLLYQYQKNLSVFAGRHSFSSHTDVPGYYYAHEGSNNMQVGLVGNTQLSDKLSAFGLIARGSHKLEKYEVGLTYALSSQIDINLLYQYQKMKMDGGGIQGRQQGVGYGLTYKF